MLKRANISLVAAVIPGLIAYSGIFDKVAPAANFVFFILFGFAVVSFLLCLFDDEDDPKSSKLQIPGSSRRRAGALWRAAGEAPNPKLQTGVAIPVSKPSA